MNEGFGKGATLSAGALLGENGGGFLCWGFGRIRGRAQGTGHTLLEGPAGEPGKGLVYQGLVKALETDLSLHRGPVENNGGGDVPFNGNSAK